MNSNKKCKIKPTSDLLHEISDGLFNGFRLNSIEFLFFVVVRVDENYNQSAFNSPRPSSRAFKVMHARSSFIVSSSFSLVFFFFF